MTRIVAGTAGGRQLRVPPGRGTRPTSDRAREGLFSSLEALLSHGLAGTRVLDLYAGSGALGLEALSRGAQRATLVESDPRACAVIRANARELGLAATVVHQRAERFLAERARAGTEHDAVLADPPYAMPAAEVGEVLALLVAGGWVAPMGVVVVERATRAADFVWPPGLVPERDRRYGDTVLRYARRS